MRVIYKRRQGKNNRNCRIIRYWYPTELIKTYRWIQSISLDACFGLQCDDLDSSNDISMDLRIITRSNILVLYSLSKYERLYLIFQKWNTVVRSSSSTLKRLVKLGLIFRILAWQQHYTNTLQYHRPFLHHGIRICILLLVHAALDPVPFRHFLSTKIQCVISRTRFHPPRHDPPHL